MSCLQKRRLPDLSVSFLFVEKEVFCREKMAENPVAEAPNSAHRIRVIRVDGTDLDVVNAARVSFGTEKKVFGKSDEALLRYLIEHAHLSPFRHVGISMHVRTDRATAHQFYKHVVGAEFCPTKDHAYNQLSQRYKECIDFLPITQGEWRAQSASNKQCSSGAHTDPHVQSEATRLYNEHMERSIETYNSLIKMGIAKEQARFVLPMSGLTEFIWTASLQTILHFLTLRDADDAQHEIRLLARQMDDIVCAAFPVIHRYYKKSPKSF
jgi:thymidylate synthase (FAD)